MYRSWSTLKKLIYGKMFANGSGGTEIWRTITAAIATFTAVPAPLRQLSVSVEPVQNLNGYDNPWPAGGGKNKLNKADILQNMFISTGASKIQAIGASGASCYCKIDGGQTYTVSKMASARFTIATTTDVPAQNVTINDYRADNSATNITIPTTASDNYIVVFFYLASEDTDKTQQQILDTIQVELGSSPTSYAPFANICPITGFDSVTVNRTGKNLLDPALMLNYPTCYTINPNGEVTVIAADTRSWSTMEAFPIKAGTYTFSSSALAWSDIRLSSENYATVHYLTTAVSSTTFTLAEDGFFKVKVGFSGPTYPFTAKWQLELCSTATAYEPYNGNTYTIQLGETVYGGTLDVLTGVLTVDRATVTLNGSETWGEGYPASEQGCYMALYSLKRLNNYSSAISCNQLKTYGYHNSQEYIDDEYGITGYRDSQNTYPGQNWVYIKINGLSTKDEYKTWLSSNNLEVVYELATPITITLTPEQIATLQGTNNVWSDAGDVTVEYRAQ